MAIFGGCFGAVVGPGLAWGVCGAFVPLGLRVYLSPLKPAHLFHRSAACPARLGSRVSGLRFREFTCCKEDVGVNMVAACSSRGLGFRGLGM